jgi:hypothetical protein
MFIDYIYLILILVLISSILFFIYLSYEYRMPHIMPNINNIESFIEGFSVPKLELLPNTPNPNFANNLGSFLDNYNSILANTYNRNIINDANGYQQLNSQMASNLNDTVNLLKNKQGIQPISQSFPVNKLIKTIKSNYNSQYLSLFANDINKYGVLVNDKCLTVNGLCKDEFCLQNCQNNLYTTDSQKFYTDRVNTADDVSRIMKIQKDKVNSKNVYPFNIFRSKVNDKCLNITNDGLSVETCNLNNLNQQWAISPNENICLLS